MMLHETVFEYLKPSEDQLARMSSMRANFKSWASYLDAELPDGPDKTFIMRQLRTLAMWCNVALTRNADGSPR